MDTKGLTLVVGKNSGNEPVPRTIRTTDGPFQGTPAGPKGAAEKSDIEFKIQLAKGIFASPGQPFEWLAKNR
jgi:hypothetical protein